ncbi:MAG: hypothetical protein JO035_07205 [Betaproteobacteria bacterium]|nr:hypothetical protein [Betaproteobacteria bacterium]
MKRLAAAMFVATFGAAAPAGAQEPLGRLFFTPEQRQALDARRKARLPDKPSGPAAATPHVRLDGYVKRSDGRSTVWVNGESVPETVQADSPRIGAAGRDSRVSVNAGDGGGRVELKPGEVLDRGSGEVRDVLGDGEIRVRRNRAP